MISRPLGSGAQTLQEPHDPMETPPWVLDPGITKCAREVSLAEVIPPNGDCEQQ